MGHLCSVIFDEAHLCMDPTTKQFIQTRLLTADTAFFLTATPEGNNRKNPITSMIQSIKVITCRNADEDPKECTTRSDVTFSLPVLLPVIIQVDPTEKEQWLLDSLHRFKESSISKLGITLKHYLIMPWLLDSSPPVLKKSASAGLKRIISFVETDYKKVFDKELLNFSEVSSAPYTLVVHLPVCVCTSCHPPFHLNPTVCKKSSILKKSSIHADDGRRK